MTSVVDLYEAARARLMAVPNITVYEAQVPDRPPSDSAGYVYPYLVLFPGTGQAPALRTVGTAGAGPELDWTLQVQCVGGTLVRCLQAAQAARSALVGAVLVPAAGPLLERPEQQNFRPIVDRDVRPPRLYVPLMLRCLTGN